MGIKTNDIANIEEPVEVSLAGNPNFVVFEGKNGKAFKLKVKLKNWGEYLPYDEERLRFANYSAFSVWDKTKDEYYHFMGKPTGAIEYNIQNGRVIDENVYDDRDYSFFTIGLENGPEQFVSFKDTLAASPFFKGKYDVTFEDEKKEVILFTSKGSGEEYDFEFILYHADTIDYSKTVGNSSTYKIGFNVISTNLHSDNKPAEIKLIDTATKTKHILKATTNISEVSNDTFFVAKNKDYSVTAENIRACMMNNSFLKSNFHITIPTEKGKNGTTVWLIPKGKGAAYTFDEIDPSFFINKIEKEFEDGDVDILLQDKESCEIQLDLYKYIKPEPEDESLKDEYITTLSKTYYGQPAWFDVNTIWANTNQYSDSFLNDAINWCDTGTDTAFRFTARKFDGINNETFFYSDKLYAITGYDRNLTENDLSKYVYNTGKNNEVFPLTRQPVLTHIKDQKQYFNFILSDTDKDTDCKLGILYKAYTQSGSYLGTAKTDDQDKSLFNVVNTIRLDIDNAVLDKYPKAGIVKVCLCRNGEAVSKPLTFKILPDCLYKVNDFAFLNALGGWSSFNFGGMEQTDFKSDKTTIHRTQTPGFNISSRIESVFNKEVTEQFVVQTMPITREVAEWLKELSTSVAVYELSTSRYVIVDELNVKHTSKDDLFTLQMKYHYSDSYNANIK
ncbi:hypothetical protein [Prevotella sp. 10(H)]|uniref:hypothetical protein n=1 Tax=Prevotella sp. 10(H) TaxID=1158294 RepID=UPI00068C57BF|nr:hypothetical protein [Prevotella sp. 10(H)]